MSTYTTNPDRKCVVCGFAMSAIVRFCPEAHPVAKIVKFPEPKPKEKK